MFLIVQLGFILLISACFQCRNGVASLELLDCVEEPLTVYVNKKSVLECQGVHETISQCIIQMNETSHSYQYFTMEQLTRISETCKEGNDTEIKCNNLLNKCTFDQIKEEVQLSNIYKGSFKDLLQLRQMGELIYKQENLPATTHYYFTESLPLCPDRKNLYIVEHVWLECNVDRSVVQYKNCIVSSGGGNVAYVSKENLQSILDELGISKTGNDLEKCRRLTGAEKSRIGRSGNSNVISTTLDQILEGRAPGANVYVIDSDHWVEATWNGN